MSDALILGLATLLTSIICTFLTLRNAVRLAVLHKQINSRMDEFLKSQKDLGHAEGKEQQRTETLKEKNK